MDALSSALDSELYQLALGDDNLVSETIEDGLQDLGTVQACAPGPRQGLRIPRTRNRREGHLGRAIDGQTRC